MAQVLLCGQIQRSSLRCSHVHISISLSGIAPFDPPSRRQGGEVKAVMPSAGT